jgi:hypothetical protein
MRPRWPLGALPPNPRSFSQKTAVEMPRQKTSSPQRSDEASVELNQRGWGCSGCAPAEPYPAQATGQDTRRTIPVYGLSSQFRFCSNNSVRFCSNPDMKNRKYSAAIDSHLWLIHGLGDHDGWEVVAGEWAFGAH